MVSYCVFIWHEWYNVASILQFSLCSNRFRDLAIMSKFSFFPLLLYCVSAPEYTFYSSAEGYLASSYAFTCLPCRSDRIQAPRRAHLGRGLRLSLWLGFQTVARTTMKLQRSHCGLRLFSASFCLSSSSHCISKPLSKVTSL